MDALVKDASNVAAGPAFTETPAGWTASHEAERDFLRGKEFDALVDAVVEGTYAAERLDVATLELVVREARRRQKARVTGDRPRKRPRVIWPGDLRAQAVFMEPGLAHEDVLADACAALQLRRVDRHLASYFVGPDVAKLPQRSAWAIGLQGAYAINNVEYLCSGGALLGNALAHQARGNVRRQIYFTNAFETRFAALCAIIRRCAASWRIIGDDELAAAKARARGSGGCFRSGQFAIPNNSP